MKNYFFINPVSGQGKGIDQLIAEIRRESDDLMQSCEIYVTKSVGDGERRAREIARELRGVPARFFACGGDGTNNEIINGAVSCDNIIFGVIPIGTGNDFVRSIPDAGDFLSIRAQLMGTPMDVDLISYSGILDGRQQKRYCANMFNIGFDCNVVEMAAKLKTKPLISGSLAYLLAVFIQFARKDTIELKVMEGGGCIFDEPVLLTAISNGSYCGGGMHTAPQSDVADGVFDLNVVLDVSRLRFLTLFPHYKAGTHLEVKGIERTIRVSRHERISLSARTGEFSLCADGEICRAKDLEFEIVRGAMRFNVPKKLT